MNYDSKSAALSELLKTWTMYQGIKEGGAEHKTLIDTFNSSGLCTRYKMTLDDAWCAAGLCAIFILCDLQDTIPIECSCAKMVELAKNRGLWIESDDYVPCIGELILYDWDDSGNGDNTGNPDHIGYIYAVGDNNFSVYECNKSDSVGVRQVAINGRYIRGFITPDYNQACATIAATDLTDIAASVIRGDYGNGDERKTRLTNLGYDYDAVQSIVNAMLNAASCETIAEEQMKVDDLQEVALAVIRGNYGNGAERKEKLENAGYNYKEVQTLVNEILLEAK